MLRATNAYTFWTCQLPKVLQTWRVLYILTWKCDSRHNGVQFFISHLAGWLRTRRFSEPTFRPPRATNHWKKHSESRLPYLFAHLHLLSSHSFSSLIFSLLGFSFLTLPTSAFPSVHIVGSLTSKLPSVTWNIHELTIVGFQKRKPRTNINKHWLIVSHGFSLFPLVSHDSSLFLIVSHFGPQLLMFSQIISN